MEQKIKQIVLCLYAVGALKLFSIIYFLIVRLQMMQSLTQYGTSFSGISFFGFDLVLDILTLIFLVNTIKEIKAKKAFAWVMAIAICIATAPSFALPASVYALILLFSEDVRSHFLKELEEKIKL